MSDDMRKLKNAKKHRALALFAERFLVVALILYFAIAAYGRYHGAKP